MNSFNKKKRASLQNSIQSTLVKRDYWIKRLPHETDPTRKTEIQNNIDKLNAQLSALQAELAANDQIVQNIQIKLQVGSSEEEEEEIEPVSTGILVFEGVSLTSFNSLQSQISVSVLGEGLGPTPNISAIFLNGQRVETLSGLALVNGKNTLEIIATDSLGNGLQNEISFWAGNAIFNITTLNESGQTMPNVNVIATLGDNQDVFVSAVSDAQGRIVFNNLPSSTILLTASGSQNEFSTTAIAGQTSTLTLTLKGFKAPSSISNNDFSLGTTAGWDVGAAPVQIISHIETLIDGRQLVNNDLQLTTFGLGTQQISRTFVADPNAKFVKVRFKFTTSEYPQFFGTGFNDSFSVTIRDQLSGASQTYVNTMNSLGRGAFSANGETDWFELVVPIIPSDPELAHTIQVDASVSNVGDGSYQSKIILDSVGEGKNPGDMAISNLDLREKNPINNVVEPLSFLSVGDHNFFGGKTPVYADVTVRGIPGDTLNELTLEILQNGQKVAIGELVSGIALPQQFNFSGTISAEVLFHVDKFESAKVNASNDGTLSLRVSARSQQSSIAATKEYKAPVKILALYNEGNRFSRRDEPQGGDGWALPSFINMIESISAAHSLFVNDFSNMNGGSFPIHTTHKKGNGVDMRDAESVSQSIYAKAMLQNNSAFRQQAAEMLISILNTPTYGSKIKVIYVKSIIPNDPEADPFWITVNNNPTAKAKIIGTSGHQGHFHLEMLEP